MKVCGAASVAPPRWPSAPAAHSGHRVMVSALVITSLSGLTYIGAAAVDVYGRARKHKQLQQQQQQQQN